MTDSHFVLCILAITEGETTVPMWIPSKGNSVLLFDRQTKRFLANPGIHTGTTINDQIHQTYYLRQSHGGGRLVL